MSLWCMLDALIGLCSWTEITDKVMHLFSTAGLQQGQVRMASTDMCCMQMPCLAVLSEQMIDAG